MIKDILRYLKKGAWYGLVAGVLYGPVDLAVRVLSLNFEWFELYQAFLVSIYVAVPLFALLGLLLGVGIKLRRRPPAPDFGDHFFLLLLVFLALLLAAEFALNFLVFPDRSYWEPEVLPVHLLLWLALSTALVAALRSHERLLPALRTRAQRLKLPVFFANYLFAVLVFVGVCLTLDLYLLHYWLKLPPPPQVPPSGPNVIFITLDTVRADSLSAYGYGAKTSPHLDRWAEKAVLFERAFSTTSWTLPSHASMFTGQYIHRHGATRVHQKLSAEHETLAERLKAAGYLTAGFVGAPYVKAKWGLAQGFDLYRDRMDFFDYFLSADRVSLRRVVRFLSLDLHRWMFRADYERTSPEINRDLFAFLAAAGARPFFIFINYYDAHAPYNLGRQYRARFTDDIRDDEELEQQFNDFFYSLDDRYQINSLPSADRDYVKALYDTEIYYQDKQFGAMLAELDRLGLSDNTIIVVVGDHGEEFFEHGGVFHLQTLYNEVLHIPLIIQVPQRYPPRRVTELVGVLDVYPTILELLDLERSADIDGVSLVPLLAGAEGPLRNELLAERYGRPENQESRLKSLIRADYKLIKVEPPWPRIPNALFDLRSDFAEQHNLYGQGRPEQIELEQRLSELQPDW